MNKTAITIFAILTIIVVSTYIYSQTKQTVAQVEKPQSQEANNPVSPLKREKDNSANTQTQNELPYMTKEQAQKARSNQKRAYDIVNGMLDKHMSGYKSMNEFQEHIIENEEAAQKLRDKYGDDGGYVEEYLTEEIMRQERNNEKTE